MPADPRDLTPDEIADGLALWQEHKPQSADDWRAVAGRVLADPEQGSYAPSPMFGALLAAEAELAAVRQELAEATTAIAALMDRSVQASAAEAALRETRHALREIAESGPRPRTIRSDLQYVIHLQGIARRALARLDEQEQGRYQNDESPHN